MSDTKQSALDYFKSNAETKELFATTDGFLFTKRSDAMNHAKTLDFDHPSVETITNDGETEKITNEQLVNAVNAGIGAESIAPAKTSDAKTKPSVAEYKELKDKATVEYKELFGADPDSKLSGAKIQELNDAKKAELANEKN